MRTTVCTLLFLAAAGAANASVIASYDAGVAPTAGTGGAPDPSTQGWTQNGTLSGFTHGAAANGGWRITDGTGDFPWFYSQSLSAADVTGMNNGGWVASWTTAVNSDAVRSDGVPNGVDNYYIPPNESRQNDNAMWIEVSGLYRYILTHKIASDGDILIGDGTTDFAITNTNDLSNLSEELGSEATTASYVTYTLSYDTVAGTATLTDSLGGTHGVIATSGAATQNRVLWGATSSGGQGSTTWNQVSLTVVPEPSTCGMAIIGALLLSLRMRRRRR